MQSWCPLPRTYEGRPRRGRAAYTAVYGARLSSVPSGDRSANPASVPGRSGLQRAHTSVSSARKRSGAEIATPSGVSAASSAFSCRLPFQDTKLAALITPEASLESGPRAGSGNGTRSRVLSWQGRPPRWSLLTKASPGSTAGTS